MHPGKKFLQFLKYIYNFKIQNFTLPSPHPETFMHLHVDILLRINWDNKGGTLSNQSSNHLGAKSIYMT